MIECINCHRPYPDQGVPYRCSTCGGLFDYSSLPIYNPDQIEDGQPGLWRYVHALGLPQEAPVVSLGEGNTPLVWEDPHKHQIAYKLEYLNPTGSFKDRGSATLVSFLSARGTKSAVEDSSGNAGASFAAYAARAGIKAQVYMPDSAAGPKRRQIEAFGAQVIPVPGPRSNAAEAVTRAAGQGEVYASHAYLPFNLPGYATIAYELYGQLGTPPGTLICPVGQGGLLLGASRGFEAMQQAGIISQVPRLLGVQALACAPLWAVYQYGAGSLVWVREGQTLAEGVRVYRPLRGDAVLKAIDASNGSLIAVDEEDIINGHNQLASMGFYVEPTSAIVWRGLTQAIGRVPEPIVVILTGSGLKSDQ